MTSSRASTCWSVPLVLLILLPVLARARTDPARLLLPLVAQVNANGNVVRSEILGAVKMKCYLSGMPELRLGLNDKVMFENTGRSASLSLFSAPFSPSRAPLTLTPMLAASRGKAIEMEDVKFHQCVRLSRFENDRTISFIPPDGEFELMSYRLNTQVKPLIWAEALIEQHSGSRIEYVVKVRLTLPLARSTSGEPLLTTCTTSHAGQGPVQAPLDRQQRRGLHPGPGRRRLAQIPRERRHGPLRAGKVGVCVEDQAARGRQGVPHAGALWLAERAGRCVLLSLSPRVLGRLDG